MDKKAQFIATDWIYRGAHKGCIMPMHIIVAMSQNRVIGKNNDLPWRLPKDLKHFKSLTMGHPIIMGRKTYESIGKPLPGRTNIVVSRQPQWTAPDCMVYSTLDEAIEQAYTLDTDIFIIGGGSLYSQALPKADILHVTQVLAEIDGDCYFPKIDEDTWQTSQQDPQTKDEKHAHDFNFLTLERKKQ